LALYWLWWRTKAMQCNAMQCNAMQCNEDYLLLPLKLPSANVEAYFENF
jgi:hypothetical protein